jgi:hypothetical protein
MVNGRASFSRRLPVGQTSFSFQVLALDRRAGGLAGFPCCGGHPVSPP